MCSVKLSSGLENAMQDFILKDFSPNFDQLQSGFATDLKWQRVKELGTELWIDSGSIKDIEQVWTREFSAVTVNNTLLNTEIQAGTYDTLIPEIADLLDEFELTEKQKMLEINFALNAYHGLRLVEKFDSHVSLEEHTDLANDVRQAVYYAKRFYAICPERFYVKIPFTAAGLLATRILSMDGIPVNHTLGFSARQNYLIASIAKPDFVNVFLGRLNSFVADNQLGSGEYIGEKATLASQKVVRQLRDKKQTHSRQIGASFRSGQQVYDLAGLDVLTIPPKAAAQFRDMDIGLDVITDRSDWQYTEGINKDLDPASIRLNTLWDVNEELRCCVDVLKKEHLDEFTPDDLYEFFKIYSCQDVLVKWTEQQRQTSITEGKIPKIDNWSQTLESGKIGLDSLMNLAGLSSFTADQRKMDEKIKSVLEKK